MLLNHAEALCLKLHIAGTQFIIHTSNPCLWISVSTLQSLWSLFWHFQGFHLAHPRLYQPAQHNIPQHFPSSVYNSMKDADTIASILHTLQTSADVTVQWRCFVNIQTTDFKCPAVSRTSNFSSRLPVWKKSTEDCHFRASNIARPIFVDPSLQSYLLISA